MVENVEDRKRQMEESAQKIKERMSNVGKKIIVLSNKGGVGKTTVAVLLARALAADGGKVGLLDADVHGPSIIKAMGLEGQQLEGSENAIHPLEKNGMKVVSVAALTEGEDTPLIWRGPLKSILLRQFLSDVEWGTLDWLVVDSPPGTGDEPMSVIQLIGDIDGGIVVTTPQKIALLDSRKCVGFLKTLNVPVLGIIENMSGFICPNCGAEWNIFKKGGAIEAAKELNVPYLGNLPIDPRLVDAMDSGLDYMMEFPNSPVSEAMREIIGKIKSSFKEEV